MLVGVCDNLTAGGGRFAGVDVADDDHVDVHLLFTVLVISACSFVGLEGSAVDVPHVDGVCLCSAGWLVWKFALKYLKFCQLLTKHSSWHEGLIRTESYPDA